MEAVEEVFYGKWRKGEAKENISMAIRCKVEGGGTGENRERN